MDTNKLTEEQRERLIQILCSGPSFIEPMDYLLVRSGWLEVYDIYSVDVTPDVKSFYNMN